MKKICFLSFNVVSPWGGSEDLWFKTALILARRGYKVYAIVLDWKERESKHIAELADYGVKITRIPFVRTVGIRARMLLNPFLGDMRQKLQAKALINISPDLLVHTNLGPRGEDVLEYAVEKNIPYVLDIQLADEFLWHTYNLKTVQCYKQAKAVYFLSDKNKTATEKQLAFKLPNAKRHYNPIKSMSGLHPIQITETIKFACVGRMGIEHKRQDLLLEILASDTWKDRNWELHFFGKGEHFESLQQLIKMYKLESKVFLRGQVESIDVIWKECQALLLPSTYEGMSLAVMECMQAGRVPIVTNAGGNSEFIVDGKHGFIAEAATYNLFSEAMKRAWLQLDSWPAIGLEAQKHLIEIVPADASSFFADEILSFL